MVRKVDSDIERSVEGSKYSCIVTFFHDIEQNFDSDADIDKCRDALKEVIKIERKHGISTTYNIVGQLFKDQPDIIDEINRSGHEVAFHSYHHQNDWNPKYYHDEIKLCRELTSLPMDYRSPRSQWDRSTIEALQKYKFIWTAEDDKNSEPYFIKNNLIRLPVSQDDWSLYNGKVTFKNWREEFLSGIKKKNYYAIGTHDYILSQSEDHIDNWEKLIEISLESNLYIVSFIEAVLLYFEYLKVKKIDNVRDNIGNIEDIYKNNRNKKTKTTYPISKIDLEIIQPRFPILKNSLSQAIRKYLSLIQK